jgi:hypothetical protein
LFVGSSSEGLAVAQAIQGLLDPICEVRLWTQGVFGLTQGTLESLVRAAPSFDFAILVLGADDLSISRGAGRPVARDNVVFELGLFIGSLGRDRTYIVYDRTNTPALPSDLAGVGAATFAPHADGNLKAALGAACTTIQDAIQKLGTRHKIGRDTANARRLVTRLTSVGVRKHHLEVWALNAEGRVSHAWWPDDDGARVWNKPFDFNAPSGIVDITAASRGPDHCELFAIDGDLMLWRRPWRPGRWSGWEPFNGQRVAPPLSSCSYEDGHIEIFALDPDTNAVIHAWSWEAGQWEGWEPIDLRPW